ncbi:PREDICTED: uncharacterized protein LOC106148612 [Chinchilla lanigera]|uniref:uncharacterized protein LOC106148612 n=1 Tax=Chinchilla lanigera TaxID=34839 RepID=UPI0006981A45|nr:PREDICTED: uncharacterized protein LOC106148612 [Chinchilla lanigera]
MGSDQRVGQRGHDLKGVFSAPSSSSSLLPGQHGVSSSLLLHAISALVPANDGLNQNEPGKSLICLSAFPPLALQLALRWNPCDWAPLLLPHCSPFPSVPCPRVTVHPVCKLGKAAELPASPVPAGGVGLWKVACVGSAHPSGVGKGRASSHSRSAWPLLSPVLPLPDAASLRNPEDPLFSDQYFPKGKKKAKSSLHSSFFRLQLGLADRHLCLVLSQRDPAPKIRSLECEQRLNSFWKLCGRICLLAFSCFWRLPAFTEHHLVKRRFIVGVMMPEDVIIKIDLDCHSQIEDV